VQHRALVNKCHTAKLCLPRHAPCTDHSLSHVMFLNSSRQAASITVFGLVLLNSLDKFEVLLIQLLLNLYTACELLIKILIPQTQRE
jgi:hypothetical protein